MVVGIGIQKYDDMYKVFGLIYLYKYLINMGLDSVAIRDMALVLGFFQE